MLPDFAKVKGIHPGAILKRELKKRNIKNIQLANAIEEFPQTISAITKEKRSINPALSLKLGDFFDTESDYFMLLQASSDVKKVSTLYVNGKSSLGDKVRKSIFWDTQVENIDWEKNKRAVIKRLLERGNELEIKAMIKFYGINTVRGEIEDITNTFSPSYEQNVQKYIMHEGL